jgi:hypothetical protein
MFTYPHISQPTRPNEARSQLVQKQCLHLGLKFQSQQCLDQNQQEKWAIHDPLNIILPYPIADQRLLHQHLTRLCSCALCTKREKSAILLTIMSKLFFFNYDLRMLNFLNALLSFPFFIFAT